MLPSVSCAVWRSIATARRPGDRKYWNRARGWSTVMGVTRAVEACKSRCGRHSQRGGKMGNDARTPDAAASADFEEVQTTGQFKELRKRHRSFVFPMAVAFLLWYFAYVLLADY